jgi:hypothetical protein
VVVAADASEIAATERALPAMAIATALANLVLVNDIEFPH